MKPTQNVDRFLARSLAGPQAWDDALDAELCVERALYAGIAGFLVRQSDWPEAVQAPLRQQALAQAMWELRHRTLLTGLLSALADRGLRVLVLKGTALAYDLYEEPALRVRGDTDLLIAPDDLELARNVLKVLGFRRPVGMDLSDDLKLQEEWVRKVDDMDHAIDLHWSAMNAIALRDLASFDEFWTEARPIAVLSPNAKRLSHVDALILACLHRAKHIASPYAVDGQRYYGGDRLIWMQDIRLLAGALGQDDWQRFVTKVRDLGLGAVCLDGLCVARERLGCDLPKDVLVALEAMGAGTVTETYLLQADASGRARRDFCALPGVAAKWRFLWQSVFPPRRFMDHKYPDMKGASLWRLYARRAINFLRR